MAVKIRLARHGAKKNPHYRVVVADSRKPRDGRLIEEVGRYNPAKEPKLLTLDLERIDYWISEGAQPTDRVSSLIEEFRNAPVEAEVAPAEKQADSTPEAEVEEAEIEEAVVEEAEADDAESETAEEDSDTEDENEEA